jgi:UDP-2,3-diacylglucosamine pyrophosphatase LpxH
MKKAKLKFDTIILSDVHLGAPGCRIDEVNDFLKHTRCRTLILNGDIIDTWQLAGSGVWTKKHTKFLRIILKKIQKHNTRVIYLRGNHDDILKQFIPMNFAGIQLAETYVHSTPQGDYLVLHGDIFDSITTHMRWLAHIGDFGYNLLLKANRFYNYYRAWRGKDYFSLSAYVKARVKTAVSFISSFEDVLVDVAKSRGYRGVICGHIHTAADKTIEGVHYLNSGDWVESLTALVQDKTGRIRVIDYKEFRQLQDAKTMQKLLKRQARAIAQGEPAPHAQGISAD